MFGNKVEQPSNEIEKVKKEKEEISVFKKNEIRIKAKNEAEDIWTKKGDFFYSS